MDVNQKFSIFVMQLALFFLSACDSTKAPQSIVDDSNSKFGGMDCYGEAIPNEYIVEKKSGSVSVVIAELDELVALGTEFESEKDGIRRIEQNRYFPQLKTLAESQLHFIDRRDNLEISKSLNWKIWGLDMMEIGGVWDLGYHGEGIKIAVIDSGVDVNHIGLKTNLFKNELEIPGNQIDDDNNGLVDDFVGFDFANKRSEFEPRFHGTHVAGIIAARALGSPMIGVAPQSEILPINIMDETGGGSLDSVLFALKYAKSRGVRIVNASWGGLICSEILKEAILDLDKSGILFVSASGNEGSNIDLNPEYPAAFDLLNQITVGAHVHSGLMAAFSNFGRKRVHILAPGYEILSTVPGGWQMASGTSMATPFVTGLSALIWQAYPGARPSDIKRALIHSVVTPKSYHPVQAGGIANGPRALKSLGQIMDSQLNLEVDENALFFNKITKK